MTRCPICQQPEHGEEPDIVKCLQALAVRVEKLEKSHQPKRNLGDVRVKE